MTRIVDRKYYILLISVAFISSLIITTRSVAQDFTAKSIGDYNNVTVMEVTGNYDAENPDGSVNADPRKAKSRTLGSNLHSSSRD